jgi:hypothetical protein
MDCIFTFNTVSSLYGVVIYNDRSSKWITLRYNTSCTNTYTIIGNLFNTTIKYIENDKKQIIPHKERIKIVEYIDDGFCLKCYS